MVHKITLRQLGGSISAVIPKELASRQRLAPNDELYVMETPDGLLLTATDPDTQAALDAYAQVARENRAAMAALAKL
jgi:putative addiction module antidote